MSTHKESKGFAPIAVVAVILVIAAIGVSGWYVMSKNNKNTQSSQPASLTNGPNVTSAPFTKSTDVDTSIKKLDSTPVDADLDTSQLDTDLNAVL